MNTPAQSGNYRKAFFLALIINLVLLGALGLAWWRYHRPPSDKTEAQPTSAGDVAAEPNAIAQAQHETQLVPIQLTSQRMQSIGVKFGTVSPELVAYAVQDEHYKDLPSRIMAISDAFNKELHDLADAG